MNRFGGRHGMLRRCTANVEIFYAVIRVGGLGFVLQPGGAPTLRGVVRPGGGVKQKGDCMCLLLLC